MKAYSLKVPYLYRPFLIEENGMKLNAKEKKMIVQRLYTLIERCPSNSFIDIKFYKESNEIKCYLSMNIEGDKFTVNKYGENPLNIYDSIENAVDRKLIYWKKNRFLNNATGIIEEFSKGYRGSFNMKLS